MDSLPLFQPYCLTVSELTRYVRQLLEGDELLQEIWVEGEISNLARPGSGHIYFTLKDSTAALRCVIWRGMASHLRVKWQDGLALQVHGSLGLYETTGQYQLYVDQVRSTGEGALFLEFLRLKTRLEKEGLFAEERKRPIPAWPHIIGIVTSPTGAALQDMLNTLRRRFPLVDVIIAPTPVQGIDAPIGIVSAIQALNRRVHPEVILVARGGGSLEDLWAFNDERVAYAIAASEAPVITGIGHETDFTIADFTADLRAPTPTAAAELATPDQMELRGSLMEKLEVLARQFQGVVTEQRWRITDAQNQLRLQSPLLRVRQDRQRLDDLMRSSSQSLTHHIDLHRARLKGVQAHIEALNPLAILERGYAVVTRQENGQIINSIHQVQMGEGLQVNLADGSFPVRVEDRDRSNGEKSHVRNDAS